MANDGGGIGRTSGRESKEEEEFRLRKQEERKRDGKEIPGARQIDMEEAGKQDTQDERNQERLKAKRR